ncbi:MAG: Zn-dependent alcohol dehydrogenase [Myxococcales bacterium]|nr:Zn-dependent alcohol dehydrogenase [Myxococcales bacterium]
MRTMRAVVLADDGPLRVEEVQLDGPEAGEVLVKITACGVCHSDLHMINWSRQAGVPAPSIFGHEASGVVEEVGEHVHTVKPGDHVVMAFKPTCGKCFYCVRSMPQLCERPDNRDRSARGKRPRLTMGGKPVNQGVGVGGFAEYTVMPEGGVIKLRDDAPLDKVCLVGCAVTTGVGAVTSAARVEAGTPVAVIGIGGVGLNVVQGARLAGARHVIAIDTLESKLELAREFGATHTIHAEREDPVARAKEITAGYLDYAFEAIGLGKTVEQAFEMIRPGGIAVSLGINTDKITIPGTALLQEKKLIGSMYGSVSVKQAIPRFVDLYMNGQIKLDELISKRRGFDEANEAFEDMKSGAVARSVLDPKL